jgi:hypothetical protein
MIKFFKHYIQNAETGKKCRVSYSLDNRIDGHKCVTLYAKSYNDSMTGVLDFENNTDMMVDYFEKDRAVLFESHPQYKEARKIAQAVGYMKGVV